MSNKANKSNSANSANVLLDCLPPVLQNVRELARICDIEQGFFDKAHADAADILREQFVCQAGDFGLARWEQLLSITPRAGMSEDERRKVVLFRLGELLPFTMRRLGELLEVVVPAGEYVLELVPEEYLLHVGLRLSGKNYLSALQDALKRILPANILAEVQLLYNTHGQLAAMKYGELARLTHKALREDVLE
jgi:hypothetical protein